MKNIEWLKKEIKDKYTHLTSSSWRPEWQRTLRIDLDTLFALFDQLDEPEVVPKPELPVIPKFVADFIESYDGDFYSLLYDADNISSDASLVTEEYYELGNWLSVNSDELLQAVANGYTVEEEQKFVVRDQHGVYLLAKNHREQGNVQTVAEIVEYYGVEEIELDYELTEQEIKDYDPRYMTFAKPVEELEE